MTTIEARAPSASGLAAAPAGLSLLVVGRMTCRDEPLRRSLRRGLAVAEFAETASDAERLLPRCHFDCIVVEVESAADPMLAWVEGLQRAGTVQCICVAAPDDPALASASLRAGAAVVLPRPLDARSLQRFSRRRQTPREEPRRPPGAPAADRDSCRCNWSATAHRSGGCGPWSSGLPRLRRRC